MTEPAAPADDRRLPVVVDREARWALVREGTIAALEPRDDRAPAPRWTTGLLDLHQHGAAGHGYDAADAAGIDAALAEHRAHGTTRGLLSLVSAPVPQLAERLRALRPLVAERPGVLGVHLEGPFLAPARRGAHDPAALEHPSPAAIEALLEAGEGVLRMLTIAPELPGALDAVDRLVAAGVVVAVGHTEADLDAAAAAFDRGASVLTHACNAMPGLGHREPGPIGAAIAREHVVLEAIADGVHVHPLVLRTLFAAAPGRVALVSDAMAATGLGDGAHRLGALDVEVRGGVPLVAGTATLAGSTLTLDRAIEVAVGAGVAIDDAVAAATSVPAGVLGLRLPDVAAGLPLAEVVPVR